MSYSTKVVLHKQVGPRLYFKKKRIFFLLYSLHFTFCSGEAHDRMLALKKQNKYHI